MSNNAHQWSPHNDDHSPSSSLSSIRDAQYLMNTYPFASATPSTHVARHLSNLTTVAIPPTYVQPTYHLPPGYNSSPSMYAHPATSHLHAQTIPTRMQDRQQWDACRNTTLQHLNAQPLRANACYPAPPSHWNPNSSPQSSFQSSPFAHSILQNVVPYHAYPTPPPPGISSTSSSLANALGPPSQSRTTHHPSESPAFFNNFLANTSRESPSTPPPKSLSDNAQPYYNTPSSTHSAPQSSPDPLSVGSPLTPTPATTPRKRRTLEVLIETPSKRFHADDLDRLQISRTPNTSSTAAKSDSGAFPVKKQVYVEITTPSKSISAPRTPNRSKDGWMPSSGDLGGYGSEDELEYAHRRDAHLTNGIRSSGKRTGDRDDRGPLEKLQALLEDVFEAADNVPPNAERDELPQEFFSALSPDPSRPLLHASLIRKLSNCVSKVARPTKRVRLSVWENGGGTPRRAGGISEIAPASLLRVLKLLERSVRLGENLEPFGDAPRRDATADTNAVDGKKSKSKKKAASAGGERSRSPQDRDEDKASAGDTKQDGNDGFDAELDEELFVKLERDLEFARDSILSADCCLALLNSDRLPKQLYSEELINLCLSAMKNLLAKVVYPFVESPSADTREIPILLQHVVNKQAGKNVQLFDVTSHRGLVKELFQALSSAIPRVTGLIGADIVSMSDTIIIQAVYIAIGPFFVVEVDGGDAKGKKDGSTLIQSVLGSSAMRGLRLDALSLVRSIFANHEEQRQWIIEEILSSLIKLSEVKQKAGHFRLRDGRSIRTVSALLLQLIQTSSHNVRVESSRIARARHQNATLRRQDTAMADSQEPLLDELYEEETRLYAGGLDAPAKAARTIVLFLTQRSGKSKTSKNANETEYRAIFDNFVSDLLTVLFWPEWPAAGLVLNIIIKFMITSLDDVKLVAQNDNNAQKSMALDHLGIIAGRLRQCMQKYGRTADKNSSGNSQLKTMDEVIQASDMREFEQLANVHSEVTAHLCKRSSEDQACESARELTAVMWGQELANALRHCQNVLGDAGGDERSNDKKTYTFGVRLKRALTDVWKDAPTDVFDTPTQAEVARVDRLAEEIGIIQSLKNAFDPILNVVLLALDAPPVFMRTKALRALSQILAVDASILTNSNVRRAIENHLLDSSPAVRDAAVELIGKYMIDSPSVAGDYFQKIAERIADTGLGVRKRVIKLLRSFYLVTTDLSKKVDICSRLVLRMLDEDETVKDLAVKTLEELWFSNSNDAVAQSGQGASQSDRLRLLSRVTVIMTVCGNFKDRQSPLDDVLHKIVSLKDGAEANALLARYGEVVDVMIDGLVDASDFPGFSTVNCIRTIHLFAAACPPIISSTKASTLLPYLKSPTSVEEQVTSDYILKIFRISIPHMSKTSAKFGNELQRILQPMVIKPAASAGLSALQETVACLCAVVQYLTHDFIRLIALLKSCSGRVNQFIARPKDAALSPQDLRALTMVVYIVSLLGEHCNFEQVRVEHPELSPDFNAVCKGPIDRYIYQCILRLYEKYGDSGLRGRLLQCLGFLFKGHPTLMTLDSSATMMDAIFASSDEEERARLLRLMQEFLVSESTKHSTIEKESGKINVKTKASAGNINMEELVGNTQGFAESGVSSAVVQRYLAQIHDAALSPHPQIQSAAVDILTFTVKQGLAHPLQSFPIIIALETSPNCVLSSRANSLHSILHHKHASLLNAGYISAARASYDYLATLENQSPQGYRLQPSLTATLHRWYSLVREKRAVRRDFLKSIVKVFDIEQSNEVSQDDLYFTRYMAENLSALEYKTLEEVLTIIKYLTSVLSTSGTHIVESLCPSQLLAQLHGDIRLNVNASDVNPADLSTMASNKVDANDHGRIALLRKSVLVGIAILLKGHLKLAYGLSEEKCSKYVLGKKSALGDRPAVRRKTSPLSWERLPYTQKPILTSQDADEQQRLFLTLWGEEGAIVEPEQDEWE